MPRENETFPVLIAQGGEQDTNRWIIDDILLAGRTSSCDILIPNPQVSRQHAQFQKTPGGVILEDLNSKNGTFLNGKKVWEAVLLKDGDVIQIALAQEFLYLSNDATIPLDTSDFPDLLSQQQATAARLRLDPDSRRVWVHDREVSPPLSSLQFDLLEIMARQEGQVIPREELIVSVWGEMEAAGVTDQALDALVRRTRERLESADPDHEYIVTIRGQGFRLDLQGD